MKKLLVFLVLFLMFSVSASALEYCKIGRDPQNENRQINETKEKSELVLQDTKIDMQSGHQKSVKCILKKGASVIVDKATGKWLWIPFCGNTINSDHKNKKEIVLPSVQAQATEKKEEVKKEEKEEEVVIETTYYEPYYAREQKLPYFWHYEPSYGYGGYYSGGRYDYNSGYHRPSTTYNYNTYTTTPPPPAPSVPVTPRGGPGPDPPAHR